MTKRVSICTFILLKQVLLVLLRQYLYLFTSKSSHLRTRVIHVDSSRNPYQIAVTSPNLFVFLTTRQNRFWRPEASMATFHSHAEGWAGLGACIWSVPFSFFNISSCTMLSSQGDWCSRLPTGFVPRQSARFRYCCSLL